jgi:hypothetical protein
MNLPRRSLLHLAAVAAVLPGVSLVHGSPLRPLRLLYASSGAVARLALEARLISGMLAYRRQQLQLSNGGIGTSPLCWQPSGDKSSRPS